MGWRHVGPHSLTLQLGPRQKALGMTYISENSIIADRTTKVLTVGELTLRIKQAVEGVSSYPMWVEGEASNVKPSSSGHLYFTLKDNEAVLSCVMWKSSAARLPFTIKEGARVQLLGSLSLYPPRGQYQMVAVTARPLGVGDLRQAFELMKQRLHEEGLFDNARKVPIPPMPECIGVVTSPTGAAIRDIIETARQRNPGVHLVVYPAKVQGEGAAEQIARGITTLDQWGGCDIIIVARGGGSLEDLWSFNEEVVARSAAACRTPLVSGVGHEVDFTIIDFVADLRAPTPTGAAQLTIPAAAQLRERVEKLEQRLDRALQSQLKDRQLAILELVRRLERQAPMERLGRGEERLRELYGRLEKAGRNLLTVNEGRLGLLCSKLNAMNPLSVLERGYAVVNSMVGEKAVIRDAATVAHGDMVQVTLAVGQLECQVINTKGADNKRT